MHRLDCDEYVDMGEHNKPLCKKNGYRPAECELCPTRVAALEAENDKLRELVTDMWPHVRHRSSMCMSCEMRDECVRSIEPCLLYEPMERRMRELGIEVSEWA